MPSSVKRGGDASQALFRFSRFSSAYRTRLLNGLQDVNDFLIAEMGVTLRGLIHSKPRVVDRCLGRYVMHMYTHVGTSALSRVKHGLLGCQHLFPRLRNRITTAWENLRVWEEQRVTRLRSPLPIPLWGFMIGLARAHGRTCLDDNARIEWFTFALMLEIGVLCMLRPGELCKLKHSDFVLPDDFALGQAQAAIRIVAPKNRRQFGAEQFVTLKNPNVICGLRHLLSSDVEKNFWPSKPRRFSVLFKQVVNELGLDSLKLTPGSLRPGGATMFFGRGVNIASLRFMGRWTAERSLEHYIQQAMATQIVNRLPSQTIRRLKHLGAACLDNVLFPECADLIACLPKCSRKDGAVLVRWCASYAGLGL